MTPQPKTRTKVAALSLSAAALVAIVSHEGYRDRAYVPVPGDRLTIGFGSTEGVKAGDTTTPTKALVRALADVQKFEGALKQCVTVPLHQYEYDAFLSLAYNIGPTRFCSSSLVKMLNAGSYAEACRQILRWDRQNGQVLPGLTKRRQEEYRMCVGEGKA